MQNIIHVFTTPNSFNGDILLYRRNRLFQYLLNSTDTKKAIWIASSRLRGHSEKLFVSQNHERCEQWQVTDIKSLVKFNPILQHHILKHVKKQHDPSNRYYLWYTYPAFSGLLKLNLWEKVIYDCSDYWVEAEQANNPILNKMKRWMIARSERDIVNKADHIFTTSTYLEKHIKRMGRDQVLTIENGVEFDRYHHTMNSSLNNDKPTLGFIGGLKPWKIDFSLLLNLSRNRPEWNIKIVGPYYGERTADFLALIEQPNVIWIDGIPYAQVPEMISTFDVGILPYLENDYNQGVFPLKMYEYLACGKPVVGCGLPSTTHRQATNIYEHVEGRVEPFIAACERALQVSDKDISRRLDMARSADWNAKFEYMWTVVNS